MTWGAIQCCAILAERALQGRRWCARVPRLLRCALSQAAAITTLLVQLPLTPTLLPSLAWFHVVGLPFFLCNAARLEQQQVQTQRRAAKLAMV